jgi:hypothetical protein
LCCIFLKARLYFMAKIATNFNISGAYVTAMTLYTTEGRVTSGVATLSNGNTIEITVTETPQSEQQ